MRFTINIVVLGNVQDRMMRKKTSGGETQPVQLGFDFEFTQTVATIERIHAATELDEGDGNADWKMKDSCW